MDAGFKKKLTETLSMCGDCHCHGHHHVISVEAARMFELSEKDKKEIMEDAQRAK